MHLHLMQLNTDFAGKGLTNKVVQSTSLCVVIAEVELKLIGSIEMQTFSV